jgi:hypothetical protein
MNTMFSNIKDIAYPESGLPVQDIPGQVAKGIHDGIKKSTEATSKLVDKLDKVQKRICKSTSKNSRC